MNLQETPGGSRRLQEAPEGPRRLQMAPYGFMTFQMAHKTFSVCSATPECFISCTANHELQKPKATVFTFSNGSGSKYVVLSWNVWFRVPEHECYTRPHQNPSTHTENVKKCKNRGATVFTFVSGSGSKKVLVYCNVCHMVPTARTLCSATPACFRSAKPIHEM
jgi:hypothetical protein